MKFETMKYETMKYETMKYETMKYETMKYETRGAVAWIRMNRPDAMNAFNAQMVEEFNAAIDRFRDDPELKAAVVAGEGRRAFCAGRDMKEDRSKASTPRASLNFVEQGYCNKPLVAAIRGHCVGQGIAVALSCDLRVCASDAVFSAPEVAHGMAIGGLGALIVRAIGLPAATELCLLADKRDATWALKWGMAHQVVIPGEEEAAAEKLALRLAGMDTAAMQVSKQALQKSVDLSFREVVEFAEPLRKEVERARLARRATGGH